MNKIELNDLAPRELAPGYSAKFVHSKNVTCAYWDVKSNSALPEHSHPNEQVTNVIEGQIEITADGVTHALSGGSVLIIPADVKHSATSITDCRLIDVFYPIRDDYR